MAFLKKQRSIQDDDKDMEQLARTHSLLVETKNNTAAMDNNLTVSFKVTYILTI